MINLATLITIYSDPKLKFSELSCLLHVSKVNLCVILVKDRYYQEQSLRSCTAGNDLLCLFVKGAAKHTFDPSVLKSTNHYSPLVVTCACAALYFSILNCIAEED